MSVYLIHKSELEIIRAALEEYKKEHCSEKCPNSGNCINRNSCGEIQFDFSVYHDKIDMIDFYENHPTLQEAMEKLDEKGQHQPRWRN